jgi:signal transduction histidine kinase
MTELIPAVLDRHPLVLMLMSMMDGLLICDVPQLASQTPETHAPATPADQGVIFLTNEVFRRVFRLGGSAPQWTDLPTALQGWLGVHLNQPAGSATLYRDEFQFNDQGIPRSFEVQTKPLCQEVDGLKGFVLVFHDVSTVKQTERMRRDFVANVSHELRTPLSAIKGYAETLLDGALVEDQEVAQEFVSVICKHANRLSALVEDLLDLSKLETEDFQPEMTPVNLNALVERVIGLSFDNAAVKQIRLRNLLPADLPWVMANSNNLEQVFTNLVDNAIKYTPEMGNVVVSAKVMSAKVLAAPNTATDSTTPPTLEITIADTGIGIEAKHIPRLFERFYRVDKARSRNMGGTGLGLSIVKHIIQYHGGDIWVDSQPNEGSRFHFTLRVAQPEALQAWQNAMNSYTDDRAADSDVEESAS